MNRIRQDQTYLQEEEDLLWERFFEICDDIVGENTSHKYIVPGEHPIPPLSIGREMHQAAPRLDIGSLKNILSTYDWKQITRTERVLDMEKLEKAIAGGKLDADIVEDCTEYKEPVAHKKFRMATKEELEGVQQD